MNTEGPLSVLVLTRNFPPLRGGMERLVLELTVQLAARDQVRLVGPAGCQDWVPAVVSATGVPLRPLPLFLMRVLLCALRLGWHQRPHVLVLGSGLMAPVGWLAGRLLRVPVVCLLHGLDVVAPHPVYRRIWLPAIRRCTRLVANSLHTARLASAAGVPADRLCVIHPGVLPPAELAPEAIQDFRSRHALAGPVLLSVGRLTARKGLAEFIRLALPAVIAQHPRAVLLVIGGEARHALGKAALPVLEGLRSLVAELRLEAHVRFAGEVGDQELALAYAAASVLVFPVLDLPGDVEGFGMVALEAAAQGLPSVAFAVGGVPDAIAEGVSGLLVPPGDYAALAGSVNRLLGGERVIEAASCRAFAAGFSWSSRGQALRSECLRAVVSS